MLIISSRNYWNCNLSKFVYLAKKQNNNKKQTSHYDVNDQGQSHTLLAEGWVAVSVRVQKIRNLCKELAYVIVRVG